MKINGIEVTTERRAAFWNRVEKIDDCWPWTGAKASGGYGHLLFNNRRERAHRIAFIFTKGAITPGLCVCHHCDNPPCCNPAHLFLGTKKDNTQDMIRKGRARGGSLLGEKNRASKLTEQHVRAIRKEYAEGGISQKRLAAKFGVVKNAIWEIVHRRKWGHVKEA